MTTTKNTEALQVNAKEVAEHVAVLAIGSDEDFDTAGRYLTEVVDPLKSEITDTFGPLKKQAHDHHKAIITQEKRFLAPLQEAEGRLRRRMGAYVALREKRRREVEQERRAAAQALAEEEALEKAAQLENQGRKEEATALVSKAAEGDVPVAPPPPEPELKASTVSTVKSWAFEIVDASKVARGFCKPDESLIRKMVKAQGQAAVGIIGGIRVFETTTVRRKGSR